MTNLNTSVRVMKNVNKGSGIIMKLLVCVFMLVSAGIAQAQTVAGSYLQSKTSSTYTAITGTTAIASYGSGTSASGAISLPFTFNFNGVNYSSCYIHPSGYITFGAASAAGNYTPLSTASSGVTGVISALACNYLTSSSAIVYGTVGTLVGSRVFTVQWSSAQMSPISGNSMNFQINLFETSNKIQVVYGSTTPGSAIATAAAQVGIASSTTDFLNWKVTPSSATTTAATTSGLNWALLQPGSQSNTSACTVNRNAATTTVGYYPASGLTLEWTPRLTLLSPSAITNTGFTINWSAATGATSYLIEVGTSATLSGSTTTTVSAPATSTTITGLTTGTLYYYRVTPQYSSGGFLTASTIYSITMPVATPLSLTSGSFNYDIIADGGKYIVGNTSYNGCTNNMVTYNGLDHGGYNLVAGDFYNVGTVASLPIGGSLKESTSSTGIIYQFQPYFQNNCYWFASGSGSGTGTLTLATPAAAQNLYIFSNTGAGANTASFTVNFTDGSSQSFTGQSLSDWCSSTGAATAIVGRVNSGSGDAVATCPYINKINLAINAANINKLVSSVNIQVTGSAGTYPAIFGITAQRTSIITPSVTSLSSFASLTCAGTSPSQSFVLTGSNLSGGNATGTGNITVTAPAGFKVSLDNITFTSTVNVPFVNCAIAGTTVYARMESTTIGVNSGNITFSGGNVNASNLPTITLSGTVSGVALKPALATSYPSPRGTINFGVITSGVTSAPIVDSLIGYGLTGTVNITSTNPDFQYSLDGISYGSSVSITPSGSTITPAIPFYTRVTPSTTGAITATLTMSGGTPTTCTYTFKDSVFGAAACVSPSLPTTLTFSGTNATGTSVGFTAGGAQDGYLVVRSTVSFVAGSDPVAGTNYAVSSAFGNGTVIAISNSVPPYAATGLTGNTAYYYTIVPFNGGTVGGTCGGGPLYASGTQLTGSVITCPATPGTPTSSSVTKNSFVASWTAPTGGTATTLTYLVDVSTNNTFTAPITGSPFTVSGTSLTVTGLLSGTAYYVRVTAVGACNSTASGTLTVTTIDNYSSVTIASGFNADIVANGSTAPQLNTSFPVSGVTSFDNAGFDLVGTPYSFATTTYRLPAGGSFTSAGTTGLPYQLADYASNNALLIHSGLSYPTTGTLTFPSPVSASIIYFLGISGTSTTALTFRLNFTDGTTETTSAFTYPDWYATSVTAPMGFALRGIGRVSSSNTPTTGEGTPTTPSLFQATYTVSAAGQAKQIASVTANYSSGTGYVGVMGVSIRSGSLITSVPSLPAFSGPACSTSSAQTFTISGSALFPSSSNITVKAPANFQVSANGSTWDTTALIPYTGNTLTGGTVYVRMNAPAVGTYTGNITFSGGTVNSGTTVTVTGTSTGLAYAPSTTIAFGPVSTGTSSVGLRDTVIGSNLVAGTVTITSSNPAFELSSDSLSWSSSLSFANTTTISAPYFIRFTPASTGAATANITMTSTSMTCLPSALIATGTGAVACTTPSAPASVSISGVTSSALSVNVTPSGSADAYMVIRSYSAFVPGSAPVTGTSYAVADTIGNGRVAGIYTSASPYAFTGLNGNTTYFYTVIPYNGGVTGTCAGGPLYATGTPVSASVTTCPGVPVVGTPSATVSTATLNWTGIGGSSPITYTIDFALDNAFTMPVTGSPFTVAGPATSLTVTSLPGGGTYYYRIKASNGTCTSAYSATSIATTTAYCTPTWTAGCSQWRIYSVATTGLSYTGTCGSASNQTALIDTMIAGVGKTHTIVSGQYLTTVVYVDLNNNGTFTDDGETIFTASASTAPPNTYTPSLVIPIGTAAGYHRMRVMASWPGIALGPCGAYSGAGGGNFYDFTIYLKVPQLITSVSTLPDFGNVATCSTSSVQSLNISSVLLAPASGNIVAHAPANFQVSVDGSSWDTAATFAYTGSTLSSTPVYVRFAPNTVGAASTNIAFTGGGIATTYVAISGTANGTTLSSTTPTAFGPIDVFTASAPVSYSFTGSGLTAGTTTIATSNGDFQVSPDNVTYYTSSYSFASGATISSTPVYIKFTPTVVGAATATITITSPTGCVQTITVNGSGALPCTAPSAATTLTFSGTTASATTVGFIPSGSADGFLIVRSFAPFVGGSDPISAHAYAVNDTFGNGSVVGNITGSSFPVTGLVSNTRYYYTIVPYNGGVTGSCSGGPLYPAGSPLTGSVITCPGVPTSLSAVPLTSGMTVSWVAPAGGTASSLTYTLEVSSNAGFTAPISGSPFTISGSSTSLTFGGLAASTTYYFRVTATGSCTGVVSSTGNATTTLFDYSTIPFTSGSFNADVIANGTAGASASTTADFDGANYNFLAADYNAGGFTPVSGQALTLSGSFNSAATSGLPYQLQSYSANNSLRLLAGNTGTLTLSTPQYASQVYLLASSGSGIANPVTFTANFEGGGTDVLSASVADWYGGTPIAIGNVGRVNRTTNSTESGTTGPNYYEYYLPISSANYSKRILSITVTHGGTGGVLNVAAASKRSGALFASTNVLPAFATTNVGCTSTAQSFTISGSTLYPAGGNITVMAPTGFQVSNNGTSWDTMATVAYTGNALAPATVYVRFNPGSAGAFSGNVTFNGGTANNTPLVAVSGTGTNIAVGLSSSAAVYCAGSSAVTLTASSLVSYSWAPSTGLSATTGSVVTATPAATTTYTVTGTDAAGCSTYTSTVTVTNNQPTTSVTGPGSVLCLPGVMVLTEGGTGGTWSSSNASVATVDNSGIVYGVASSGTPVTLTYNNPVCGGSATYSITVSPGGFTVSTTPGTGTYCSTGSPLSITASGASSYSWSPSAGLSSTGSASVNASPTVTTTYTVVGTTGACSNATTITVWNTTPGAITGGITSLCVSGAGSSTTWSDTTAGGTWSVSNTAIATITSGGVITAVGAGTATVTYNVSGCYVTRALTVNANPTLSVSPATISICGGSAITMTATGAATYSWLPTTGLSAATGASVATNPASSITYTLTGTSAEGCVSTTTKFVGSGPGVNAFSSASTYSICPAGTTTLSTYGYLTSGNTYDVRSIPYAPVTFTSAGSVTGDDVYSAVITLPFTFNFYGVNYNSLNISTNGYVSFTAAATAGSSSGRINYACPTASLQGQIGAGIACGMHDFNASGTMITYGSTGTAPNRKFVVYFNNLAGFSGTGTMTSQLILNENNTVDIMIASLTPGTSSYGSTFGVQSNVGTNGVAPAGRSAMGTATAISTPEGWRFGPTIASPTYAWLPSATVSSSTSASPTATPDVTTVYTVTITDAATGCTDTALTTINTFTPPNVTIPTPTVGCSGVAMTASGAASYAWTPSTGLSATTGVTVTPSATVTTTTYSVVGTDANGCKDTATIVVNPTPTVTVTPTTSSLCAGGSNSLTATGASTYSWTPSATLSSPTGATVSASPISNTTYSVIGTSAEGCVAAVKTATITVNPIPVAAAVTGTTAYCLGSGAPFTLNTSAPTGTGLLVSYNWSGPGGFSATTTSPTVSYTPTSTSASGVYSLTVTYTGAGCTSNPVTTGTAIVADYPVAFNVTGGNGCSATGITVGTNGSQSASVSYTLKLLPSSTVQILGGASTSLSFNPVTTPGTYVVVATGPAGCQTTMNGADTLHETPSATIGAVPSICQPLTSAPVAYSAVTGAPTTYNIDWDAAANAAGISDVTNGTLSGGSINFSIPASGAVGHYTNTITVSNGYCTSSAYNKAITIYAQPQMSITGVNTPCVGYPGSIDFTGTDSATVDYTVDGGPVNHFTFSGTTYSLSTGTITTPHTYVIQSANNPVCSNTYDSIRVVDPTPMKWVGGAAGHESEWNYAANWTCGFEPGNNDDVTIDAATYTPEVSIPANGTTRNLTLNAGAAVLVNSGASLNVKGNINNGAAISGAGKVVMNATSAQTIQGIGTIENFELNNAAGATINSGSRMMIGKALYMSAGMLTTNDSLELLSNDTFTAARIAEMPASGTSIVGKVKVGQFVPGGTAARRFRFWAHPFSDTISLGQIQKYIDITGTADTLGGFTHTGSNSPSAFWYNPYTANDTLSYSPGWKAFLRIDGTESHVNKLHPGQGMRLFIRGAKGEGLSYDGFYGWYTPSETTIKMMGRVNQGDVDVHLAQGATELTQSLNLVGNPYASPVDIGTILYNAKQAGQITGSAFYLWMPRIAVGGQYMAVPIGESAPIPYYIQANAAFQVRAALDGAVLHFTENKKSANADNYVFKPQSEYVTLNVYDNNGHVWDRLDIQFNEKATVSNDKNYDAIKPMGSDLNFYAIANDGVKMAIDARPYSDDQTIPLGIRSNYAQPFVIRAENVATPNGGIVTLHDKFLGKYVDLTPGTEYAFTISNSNKATQGDERFELTLRPAIAAAKPLAVSLKPNPASDDVKITFTSGSADEVKVRVMDISGVSIFTQNLGAKQSGIITVPMSNFAAGVYMVEVTQGTQKVTQKLIKE